VNTPNYRQDLLQGRQPRLPLSERLRHAILEFRIVLAEDLARFERRRHAAPSYILMAGCPSDVDTCPEYYDV
jgi:hypothetical protein